MMRNSVNLLKDVYNPSCYPFNGINPRSVMILDKAAIHHVESAINLIEEIGALAIFFPPYPT